MHRFLTLPRLGALFLMLFAVAVAGTFAYQHLVLEPGERCEAGGRWWDSETRTCAQPISIAEITGRPNGVSRAEASDAKNRELIQLESRLRAREQAIAADREAQRKRLAAEEANR